MSSSRVQYDLADQWATRAWAVLALYVIIADVGLGVAGKNYMSDAWHNALKCRKKKWALIFLWVFTTKHLFFRNFYPKIDPYGIIAIAVNQCNNKLMKGGEDDFK